MDKKEFESKVYLTYVDRFQIPLGIGLFFIFVESLISDAKSMRSPVGGSPASWSGGRWGMSRRAIMMNGNAVVRSSATESKTSVPPWTRGDFRGVVMDWSQSHGLARLQSSADLRATQSGLPAWFSSSRQQPVRSGATKCRGRMRKEMRFTSKRTIQGALDKYVEANDGKIHRQELAYNLANAFYQQKKYPEALAGAGEGHCQRQLGLNEKIYFNRGNTFFQMGKYQEAIESYKKALELDPGDKEAKHNLELALKKLQENPQEQQKNSKNKDQQSKQENKISKTRSRTDRRISKSNSSLHNQKNNRISRKTRTPNLDKTKAAGRATAEGRHGPEGSAPYSGRS